MLVLFLVKIGLVITSEIVCYTYLNGGGLTPHEIRALFWRGQQVSSLENEIELLKRELERRNKEIEMIEIKADFYRRQLVLESRFGLILQRSFY